MAPNNTDFASTQNEDLQQIESVITDNERSQIEENLKSTQIGENKRLQSLIKSQQDPKSNYHTIDKDKYHENWIDINRDNRNANFDSNRSVSSASVWSESSDKSSIQDKRHNNWGGKTADTDAYHGDWLEIRNTFTELSNDCSVWSSSGKESSEISRIVVDDTLSSESFVWPDWYTRIDNLPPHDNWFKVNGNYRSIDDLCQYVSPRNYSSESSESGSTTSKSTSESGTSGSTSDSSGSSGFTSGSATSSSVKSHRADAIEENPFDHYPTILPVADDFEQPGIILTDPIIGTSQLFGDGYFLQLCMRYTKYTYTRNSESSPITCGTVQSGLTIKKAIKRLNNTSIMTSKLIICVGTVDIYCKRPFDVMIEDYKEMLQILRTKFGHSNKQIILCTLPPMGNVNFNSEKFKHDTFQMFNNWIRYHCTIEGYKLIDFHEAFSKKVESKVKIDYKYYQDFARHLSGTIHPHVLWNYRGRQKAMKMILEA